MKSQCPKLTFSQGSLNTLPHAHGDTTEHFSNSEPKTFVSLETRTTSPHNGKEVKSEAKENPLNSKTIVSSLQNGEVKSEAKEDAQARKLSRKEKKKLKKRKRRREQAMIKIEEEEAQEAEYQPDVKMEIEGLIAKVESTENGHAASEESAEYKAWLEREKRFQEEFKRNQEEKARWEEEQKRRREERQRLRVRIIHIPSFSY